MTCKDCLHFEACELNSAMRIHLPTIAHQNADYCKAFKNKSEWVHLPCNVGDTIYFDTYKRGESIGIQPHKVVKTEIIVSTERQFGSVGAEIPDWQFGKTAFLTKEEAEKAIEERRKEDAEIH